MLLGGVDGEVYPDRGHKAPAGVFANEIEAYDTVLGRGVTEHNTKRLAHKQDGGGGDNTPNGADLGS